MRKKIIPVLVGLACVLALSVGSAGAHNSRPSLIVFSIQNLGDGSASCPAFGLSFDMVSLRGAQLGSGVSCVDPSAEGCEFGDVGCRDTFGATFTLTFARGSLTAPVVVKEAWLPETTVLQVDHGRIDAGTGDFAGARGSIDCAGTVRFTETGSIPRLVCVVVVT